MKCLIVSSGRIESYSWLKKFDFSEYFIISADGGMKHLKELGLTADLWIGDGDSLKNEEVLAKETLRFPVKKDYTDTDLAVMYALENGYYDITIIGAFGGRLDHEFSHFCLLKKILDNGGKGTLLDKKNIITMENKSFKIKSRGMKYVSFFPFGGDVKNFSVKDLLYEAEGIDLKSGLVQASSNSFSGEAEGTVTFDSGYVLVIHSND